jgi:hypothetical protein
LRRADRSQSHEKGVCRLGLAAKPGFFVFVAKTAKAGAPIEIEAILFDCRRRILPEDTDAEKNEISRTPPNSVLEQLRREVNFGCPVEGCGIPYLSWHHFDPPWRERHHHDPEGMIALCLRHAAQADADRWTGDQCIELKRNPFVKKQSISEFYGYLRARTVFQIGNLAYDVPVILQIRNTPVIFFTKDDRGYDRLNLFIVDTRGNPLLLMKDNFWTVFQANLYDLRCSARGRELEVKSKDGTTNLLLRFDEVANTDLRNQYLSNPFIDNFLARMGNPGVIPVWTVTGTMTWGSIRFDITTSRVAISAPNIRNITMSGSLISGGRAAFVFS